MKTIYKMTMLLIVRKFIELEIFELQEHFQ